MIRYFTKIIFTVIVLGLFSQCNKPEKSVNTFLDFIHITNNNLSDALNHKKNGLIKYLTEIKELAHQVNTDEVLTSFFKAKNDYYQLKKEQVDIPAEFDQIISNLKVKVNKHYLANYLPFYDMLFVNNQGDVFFTIRKESDYHANIHDSLFINTNFTKKLLKNSGEAFVDFQFYQVTGEPSAFFIEPISDKGQQLGWIILQFSVDRINHMFNDGNNIGKTGEILLVNKNHYLLTDSRFSSNPTILKQKLPDENIDAKFQEKKGNKKVIDYRGKEVFSVFEVFSFMNYDWLIIAKKDKSEVVSDFYKQQSEVIIPKLKNAIISKSQNNNHYSQKVFIPSTKYKNVYIDDYKRTEDSLFLFTQGLSTCTALCAIYPDKFNYLAHVSPLDAIYNENQSDLTQTILDNIAYFEIPDAKKNEVFIYIVCTDLSVLKNIVDKFLDQSYYLDQITIAYRKNSSYANVYSNINNEVWANWYDDNANIFSENLTHGKNLESLILEL